MLNTVQIKEKRNTTKKPIKSPLLNDYVNKITKDSTRGEVRQRLITFEEFIIFRYQTIIDKNFIKRLVSMEGEENEIYIYDLFGEYVQFLKNKNISRERIQHLVIYAKRCINKFWGKYTGKTINEDIFKDEVSPTLPDSEKEGKTSITNEDIKGLIYACGNDLKLRTVITVLSSAGMRINELLKIKYKYLKLEWTQVKNGNGEVIDIPPRIFLPSFITKTRQERYAYLTSESVECIKEWLDYKYRNRKIVKKVNGKTITVDYVRPSDISESYIFRITEDDPTDERTRSELKKQLGLNYDLTPDESIELMDKLMNTKYRYVYRYIQVAFKQLVEKQGLGHKFKNKKNNSVSIHSLRYFVVDTVDSASNLKLAYFWVGKRQKGYIFEGERDPKQVLNLYNKVERSLTFLNPKLVEQTEYKQIQLQQKEINELKREVVMSKFNTVINDLIYEKRKSTKDKGFTISPQEQLNYFLTNLPPRTNEDQIAIIKEMIEKTEIDEVYEYSQKTIDFENKFIERWNKYIDKIDFGNNDYIGYYFDDNDNLVIELKKELNRPNFILPP